MTSADQDNQYVEELLENLSTVKLHLIDFDDLQVWLQSVQSKLATGAMIGEELNLLRKDYIERISGMVKATAVVERSRDKTEEALVYIESLQNLSAAELIEQYRKTSVRFRSAFPTTFGLPQFNLDKMHGLQNPEEYK